jgi:hypothetical protein
MMTIDWDLLWLILWQHKRWFVTKNRYECLLYCTARLTIPGFLKVQNQMDTCSQRRSPTTLTQEKESPVPTVQRAGWTLQPVWTLLRTGKSLTLDWNQTIILCYLASSLAITLTALCQLPCWIFSGNFTTWDKTCQSKHNDVTYVIILYYIRTATCFDSTWVIFRPSRVRSDCGIPNAYQ